MLDLSLYILNDSGMNETLKHVMDDIEAEQAAIIAALNAAASGKDAADRRDFRMIKRDTGISASWLSTFADGGIKEPGFKKTQLLEYWLRLNNFLTDTKTISEPISAADTSASRVLARRECLSPAVATFSCSTALRG